MSPSWLDNLTLFIHPAGVRLERRGWRGASQTYATTAPLPSAEQASWQPALAEAQVQLASHARPGSCLRVVLADQFVRYAVLPWSETVVGQQARLAMARALLRHSLGEAAERLDIALDRAVFGSNGVAAGLPQALLLALRQAAKAAKLRLTSIQPRLNVELAACRDTLNDGYIVLPDDGWLTLLGVHQGSPCLLRNHRSAEPASDELPGLLATESSAVEIKKLQVFSQQQWPPTLGDWQVECRLPMFAGVAHA
ncbi:hypothetical protein AT959_05230 [Dechloromonas denitrificans]|uniref:GspL cytoplasmic actin-ATPase-like domain-containing protein n=1 Tax=Dechloromonas denitrificans TaxID=281362 RepID=A0A133XLH3_9RHOO|nr:hypothetical protein [Dechloromonas denitrificans]KXB31756.1 hypothetical protein AT959_05230 [Dechloromonas denitrificans]